MLTLQRDLLDLTELVRDTTERFAEAHGGTVTVRSRPGAGAAFTVLLPRP